jgi:pimeloyl-ACP methyl ester carboxylesterase
MASAYDPRLSIQGEGRAVVLVPGMNGSGELFYRQIPRLQRCYRVATYSLRDDADNLEVLAGDLAHVVDAVAPAERRALIVGESFGGAVALTFALQHPEQVEALVILNSFPYFSPQRRLRLAIASLTVLPWGVMPLVRHLTAFRLHSRHTHRQDVKEFIRLTSDATREGYINRLKLLRNFDARNRLAEIDRPVLLLASEHDHLVPAVEQARYMATRIPSSVMRVLEGHGHICLIAPDLDLAQILNEWRGA